MAETAVKMDQIRIPDYSGQGYKVADMAQNDFGRKEIDDSRTAKCPDSCRCGKNTRPSSL